MMERKKKESKKNVISNVVKNILEDELISLGGGTGSGVFYQPAAPKELDRYKNVK